MLISNILDLFHNFAVQMYIFLSGIPLFNKEIVQIIYVPQSKYLCFEKDVLSLQS